MTFAELNEIAKNELKGLTTVHKPDFRLEEAEYDHSNHVWNIVVSFLVENTNKRTTPKGTLTSEYQYHRIYKKLKINDQKVVVGMYMHNS